MLASFHSWANRSRQALALVLLCVLLPGCGLESAFTAGGSPSAVQSGIPPSRLPEGLQKARVTRVIDGDTVEISLDSKKQTVRMILVDTPETKKPGTEVQPFGPEAAEFTKNMLENQDVRLERDVSTTDRYGRFLYYIWIGDRMFNELLLEKGLARVAVYPPDVKYVDQFRALQKQAQEGAIGIWSIENYATDKGYDSAAQPTPGPAGQPTGQPEQEVYYSNCTEAREKGVSNILRGEPGYRAALDRDNDGIACEN